LSVDWHTKFKVELYGPANDDPLWGQECLAREVCSPEGVKVVFADFLLRLKQGDATATATSLGWRWRQVMSATEERGLWKYWEETEEEWRANPDEWAFWLVPQSTRQRKQWLYDCAWVPEALALDGCPCAKVVAELFDPRISGPEFSWVEGLVENARERARVVCRGGNCPGLGTFRWARHYALGNLTWRNLRFRLSDLMWSVCARARGEGTEAGITVHRAMGRIVAAALRDVLGNPLPPTPR
jgi:hypothetical protein